jgi:putative ABC transport system permease protein
MYKNLFKSVFRSVWKNRTVSLINIFGLSVGMTAAVLILLWVQNEFNYDRNQPSYKNIYRATAHLTVTQGDVWTWESSPLPLADQAKKEIPGIERTARISHATSVLQVNNQKFSEKNCAYIDEGWLNMFQYNLLEGDKDNFNKNPFSLILTSSKAKKFFGNEEAMGKIVRIDTVDYQVRGVVEDNPVNSSFQFDILIPLAAKLSNPQVRKNENGWGNFNYLTFLELKNNKNPKAIAKQLSTLVQANKKESTIQISLVGLKDMHFETDLQNSSIIHTDHKVVYIFAVLASVLLLIACINYVNLTTARASLRAKEVGIRKIVGADRKQLFGQFMAESFVVSVIALLITILLIQFLLPFFNQLTEKNFVLPLQSANLWKVLLGTLFSTILLNGIYPAVLLSSFRPMNVFRGMSLVRLKDGSFRKILVVIQFTMAMILIVGTVVIFKQLEFIQQTNTGYNRSQIFEITVPYKVFSKMDYDPQKMQAFTSAFKNELLSQTTIQDIAEANQAIFDVQGYSSGNYDWDGRGKDFNPTFARMRADAEYQKMFGLKMLEGRWFMENSQADQHCVILNETAARELNIHKPWVGQRFVSGGDTGRIIGIVQDFHYRSMHEKIGYLIISYDPSATSFFVKTFPGSTRQSLLAAEKVWNKFVLSDPFDFSFLDESFDKLYKADRKASQLILIFSIIAILISSLGLFALAAFTADQRTREIGIRKVLGASFPNIVRLLSLDFIKLVGLGILISIPIGWWTMNTWLQDFAYRIQMGWWMFAAAGLAACMIALFAVCFHAVKAGLTNPVKALRSE